MGWAAARVLAERGHEVTVYEQFEFGHKRGSSHGSTRIYRYSYPDARYVAMMKEAMGLWRELETEARVELLTRTGGLDTGPGALTDHVAALEAEGIEYEVVPVIEARKRWPSLTLAEDVLYQADGGFVRADLAWKAFADGASVAGAITERARVVSLAKGVATTDRTYDYDVTVVTAGAWARELLATRGIELATRPTRETVVFFKCAEVLPTLVDWGDPSVYALPDPEIGLKVGEHIAGPTTDPDEEGQVDADSVARLTAWVAERYRSVEPEPQHSETCIYTNTADQHFVLERSEDVVVGSACSGHGFKFAPLIGRLLADLAEG
ncbi:MAG: sarcosine oxidase [Actinomycetota bacterium]|nr:sarcosine oxidase [Actinomycetota bacterium]